MTTPTRRDALKSVAALAAIPVLGVAEPAAADHLTERLAEQAKHPYWFKVVLSTMHLMGLAGTRDLVVTFRGRPRHFGHVTVGGEIGVSFSEHNAFTRNEIIVRVLAGKDWKSGFKFIAIPRNAIENTTRFHSKLASMIVDPSTFTRGDLSQVVTNLQPPTILPWADPASA